MTRERVVGLLLVATCLLVAAAVAGEERRVQIRFEVDGKPRQGPDTIEFYGQDGRVVARKQIAEGSFQPPAIAASVSVEVRVRLAKRTLVFAGVRSVKFAGTWVVGIDQPPFDEENLVSSATGAEELWYIRFVPATGGDGTTVVVAIR